MLKSHELWLVYASTLDSLEREYYLFSTNSGGYSGLSTEAQKEELFIRNIEDLIQNKNKRYVDIRRDGFKSTES